MYLTVLIDLHWQRLVSSLMKRYHPSREKIMTRLPLSTSQTITDFSLSLKNIAIFVDKCKNKER